jgi:hypothetical protein
VKVDGLKPGNRASIRRPAPSAVEGSTPSAVEGSASLYTLLLFVLLALAWLWPLPTRLDSRIAHDPGDPLLNAWILWWNAQAVPFTDPWWNAPIFHPMPGAFALSEHLAGIALFTTPLSLSGLNPIALYNIALITACALSGFFACLLIRQLTGSALAGIAGGIAFAFAPYRGSQLAHLQVLNTHWTPLLLLAMHRVLAGASRRWLIVLAGAWILQGLSNGYLLLFLPVLVGLWLAWFGTGTTETDRATHLRRAGAVAGTLLPACLVLAPVLLHYKAVHSELGIARAYEEMVRFSASPSSFLQTAPLAAYWPRDIATTAEGFLFPGLTAPALVLIGLGVCWRRWGAAGLVRRRSPVLFYAGAAVIMYWLAMGPPAEPGGFRWLMQPYAVLTWLPGYDGLRAPARFAILGSLCLAIAAGFGAAWVLTWRRWAAALAVVAMCWGLFIDGWTDPIPLVTPPQRVLVPQLPGAAVLELPAHDISVNIGAMYRSMVHRMPLVNGFSGHTPPHFSVLTMALVRQDPSVLWWLASGRPLILLLHREPESDGGARAFVERAGGVLHEESGVGPIFVLPARPREREMPATGPLPGVTTTHPSAALTIADLGEERVVRSISFAARWRYADVPERMTIETSGDGITWSTAWEDWTGARLLSAALADQQAIRVRIPLPDVSARYLRIQPSPRWLPGELQVHGPGQ